MKTTVRRTDRSLALERIQPKPSDAPTRGAETRAVQAALRAIRSVPFAAATVVRTPRSDAPFICG
jgi:hypothetical protein